MALERAHLALQPLDLLSALLQQRLKRCRGGGGGINKGEGAGGVGDNEDARLEEDIKHALAECYNNRALVLLCLQGLQGNDGAEGGDLIAATAAVKALDTCLEVDREHPAGNYNYTLALWLANRKQEACTHWMASRGMAHLSHSLVACQRARAAAVHRVEGAVGGADESHVMGRLQTAQVQVTTFVCHCVSAFACWGEAHVPCFSGRLTHGGTCGVSACIQTLILLLCENLHLTWTRMRRR